MKTEKYAIAKKNGREVNNGEVELKVSIKGVKASKDGKWQILRMRQHSHSNTV